MSCRLSIFWTFVLVLVSASLVAQTPHRIGQILVRGNNVAANVAPYAKITVCVPNTSCDTAASVFADPGLTIQLTQPLTADASGNYDYYIASGCVDEEISSPGQGIVTQYNVCPFSGVNANPYTLPTASTSILGGVKIDGSSITINAGVISATGAAGNPAGPNTSVQYNNSSVFGGASVQIDVSHDASLGSLFIPKMNNLASSNLGSGGNPYWTNNTNFPQMMPTLNQYQQNFMYARDDFAATAINNLSIFGTNRFRLPSNTQQGPDTAIRYNKANIYSPNQLGGFNNDEFHAFSSGDAVFNTQIGTFRSVTEGFEEAGEWNRVFMGPGWDASPHGAITFGAEDYLHDLIVNIACANICGTYGENNYIIDESKKFVPSGNISRLITSTLLGIGYAAAQLDNAAAASMDAKYGTTLHVATVVSGADDRNIYSPGCPANVTGTYDTVSPFNPTDANGGGMATSNRCVTFTGDISSLTAGSKVCWWSGSNNMSCDYVVANAGSGQLAMALHFPHDPGEIITWGAAVGNAFTGPKGFVPRRSLDNNANFQEEDVVFTYPVVGWDSANKQIILSPHFNATASNEVRLPVYANNTPSVPVTVSGTGSAGSFSTLTATGSGNYSAATFYTGALNTLPPPTLSFHCATAPTYRWDPDPGQNVPSYIITLLTGGSGCTDFTVTTNNLITNPAWIYPATRLFRVQDVAFCNSRTNYQSGCVTGNNMKVDPLPNSSDWANGDLTRAQMDTATYFTGNQQFASSPASQGSARFGPMQTIGYVYPQNSGSSIGTLYYVNQTPGSYYWGTAPSNWMAYPVGSDPTTSGNNPYIGTGVPPAFMGIGGTWGTIFHVTDWVWAKNSAGNVAGGSFAVIDCTHPGQDQEGAATPCRDRNILPAFNFMFAHTPDDHVSYITVDAQHSTMDLGPSATIGGKTVCKTDPITHLAYLDCPVLRDYTITLASGLFTAQSGHYYQMGSLVAAVDDIDPLKNTYYVPRDCNVTNIDYTAITLGTPPVGPNVQVRIIVNGTTDLFSPLNMSWGATGTNHLNAGLSAAVTAGQQLTFQVNTPSWTSVPGGQVSTTAVLYCSIP
jgi:hypothetical protein